MKTIQKRLVIYFSLTIVLGCSSSFNLHPDVSEDKKIYLDGESFGISTMIKSAVACNLKANAEGYMEIFVKVKNLDSQAITVDPKNISLQFKDNYGVTEAKVYSADEWIKKIQNRQVWQAVAEGLSQAGESINAGTSRTSSSTYAYGSDGSSAYAYGSSTTIDYSEKAKINAMHAQRNRQMANEFSNELGSARTVLLKINTLFPEQAVSGMVIADTKGKGEYTIKFKVSNETHQIVYISDK